MYRTISMIFGHVRDLASNPRFRKEIWGLFKYGLVGGSSFCIHAGIYALLSRVVWESGSRTLEYVIALVIAALYNFTLHRLWTFSLSTYSHKMVFRYSAVLLGSMGLQSIIFHIGVERLGFFDGFVFLVAASFAALVQYLGHRFVTFNVKRFEKCEESQ